MEKKRPSERDDKDDVRSDMGKVDWEKNQKVEIHFYISLLRRKKKYYFPYFGLFSSADERMEKAKKAPDLFEKKLSWTPDHPPYNYFIRYHGQQLAMLVEYSKKFLKSVLWT